MNFLNLQIAEGVTVGLPQLTFAGLLIGIVAGMFGVGGGFMLIPTLIYFFGIPVPIAVGSATCQQTGFALATFLRYRKLKRGEPKIDIIMLGGSVIGVDAGARLLTMLERLGEINLVGYQVPAARAILDVLFFFVLILVSVTTFLDVWNSKKKSESDTVTPGLLAKIRIPPYCDLPGVGLKQISIPVLAYVGLMLGIAAGLMGIGGGIMFLPVMVYGYGIPLRKTLGSGILMLFVSVIIGTVVHTLQGRVNLILSMVILIGSSVGSQIGAIVAYRLSNNRLRIFFAGFVLITSLFVVWDIIKLLR